MEKFAESRAQSAINDKALKGFLFGTYEKFLEYDEIIKLANEQKNLQVPHSIEELSRIDAMTKTMTTGFSVSAANLVDLQRKDFPYELNSIFTFRIPFEISQMMVKPVVDLMGSDEQVAKFSHRIGTTYWVAPYIQTELAHGSDIQNLQTLATFDPQSQSFIIHSPSIESIKWWPGEVNVVGTHAVVLARLISMGKDYGVQPFFIKLRDTETWEYLPGIEAGDIGSKLGFRSKDNSFVKFNQYKVPKEAHLCRYTQVQEDGSVKVPDANAERAFYVGMMKIRQLLLAMSYRSMAFALTTAIRFSSIRKQFTNSENQEITIIDYQLQQEKLFTVLSDAYAICCSFMEIKKFNEKLDFQASQGDFSLLQEAHILLSGGKSLYTSWAMEGCSTLIKACGGHGFSEYSGIPFWYKENVSNTILEGENSILLLQVARFLLKNMELIMAGKPEQVQGNSRYLRDVFDYNDKEIPCSQESLTSIDTYLDILAKTSCYHIQKVGAKLFEAQQNSNARDAWDFQAGVELSECSKVHIMYFTLKHWKKTLKKISDKPLLEAMKNMQLVFCISKLTTDFQGIGALCAEAGSLTAEHVALMRDIYEQAIQNLKKDALVLVEGFHITDLILKSELGNSNGTPYENLYQAARTTGQLNESSDLNDYIVKNLVPFMKRKNIAAPRL